MYKSYQYVCRINSEDCAGLQAQDNCYIFPKVDGSNFCAWIENGVVHCGSRKREISVIEDNAFSAGWFFNSNDPEAERIKQFLTGYPNLRIFAEWLGYNKFIGQIKDYNQEAKAHVYIFDVFNDNTQEYLAYDVYAPLLEKYGLGEWMLKPIAVVDKPSDETLLSFAENNKFLLDNANHAGEGVVVKCYEWRNKYGRQQFGKLVLDEFVQNKARKESVVVPGQVEQEIVDTFMTDAELSKTVAKVCVACGVDVFDNKSAKMNGMVISLSWKDLLEENITTICKRWKNPVIDFANLKGIAQAKVRKYIGL